MTEQTTMTSRESILERIAEAEINPLIAGPWGC